MGVTLGSYGNAQILFNFISTQMPQNAPGSLSDADYHRILAFMVVGSGFVDPAEIFDAANLAGVPLN